MQQTQMYKRNREIIEIVFGSTNMWSFSKVNSLPYKKGYIVVKTILGIPINIVSMRVKKTFLLFLYKFHRRLLSLNNITTEWKV